jgi:hypothetical protein
MCEDKSCEMLKKNWQAVFFFVTKAKKLTVSPGPEKQTKTHSRFSQNK